MFVVFRDFGVFMDLGDADGLIHVSELAWYRVEHPKEVVKVGDEFEVQVLKMMGSATSQPYTQTTLGQPLDSRS